MHRILKGASYCHILSSFVYLPYACMYGTNTRTSPRSHQIKSSSPLPFFPLPSTNLQQQQLLTTNNFPPLLQTKNFRPLLQRRNQQRHTFRSVEISC